MNMQINGRIFIRKSYERRHCCSVKADKLAFGTISSQHICMLGIIVVNWLILSVKKRMIIVWPFHFFLNFVTEKSCLSFTIASGLWTTKNTL